MGEDPDCKRLMGQHSNYGRAMHQHAIACASSRPLMPGYAAMSTRPYLASVHWNHCRRLRSNWEDDRLIQAFASCVFPQSRGRTKSNSGCQHSASTDAMKTRLILCRLHRRSLLVVDARILAADFGRPRLQKASDPLTWLHAFPLLHFRRSVTVRSVPPQHAAADLLSLMLSRV